MDMDPTPPRTPKTPTSKSESLGIIYGAPITDLRFERKPTKFDVIQLYMHLYDEVSLVIYSIKEGSKGQ